MSFNNKTPKEYSKKDEKDNFIDSKNIIKNINKENETTKVIEKKNKNPTQNEGIKSNINMSNDFIIEEFINYVCPNTKIFTKLTQIFSDSSQEMLQLTKNFKKLINETNEHDRTNMDQIFNIPLKYSKQLNKIKKTIINIEEKINHFSTNVKIILSKNNNTKDGLYIIKKLEILKESVDELYLGVSENNFELIYNHLVISEKLLKYFKEYQEIKLIQNIKERIFCMKLNIYETIEKKFDTLITIPITRNNEILYGLKMVLKFLSHENNKKLKNCKLSILKKFAKKQMRYYKSFFKEAHFNNLRSMSKRFMWIKKNISRNNKIFRIFPKDWHFIQEIIFEFYIETIPIIKKYLKNFNEVNIKVFVDSLICTKEFEVEMQKLYNIHIPHNIKLKLKKNEEELLKIQSKFLEVKDSIDVNTLFKKQKRIKEIKEENNQLRIQLKSIPNITRNYQFIGCMSKTFDSHMDIYVEYQRVTLLTDLKKYIKNEKWKLDQEKTFKSDEMLFITIQNSLDISLSLISDEIIYELYDKVWKVVLLSYLKFLEEKIPKLKSRLYRKNPTLNNKELIYYIINVCDYCGNQINQLKEVINSKISELYKSRIVFKKCMTKVYKLKKHAIKTIVNSFLNGLKSDFNVITKNNWFKLSNGDTSPYMQNVIYKLKDCTISLFNEITFENAKMFFNILLCNLEQTIRNYVLIGQKVSREEIIQLQIDLTTLKKELKEIIEIHSEFINNHDNNTFFKKKVDTKWKKIDTILKILILNEPIDIVKIYETAFINDINFHNTLNKILKLKGWSYKFKN
jgi:hypothetical protein